MESSFNFGSEEELEFRYLGMNIIQHNSGIHVENEHYIKSLELPNMNIVKNLKMDDVMDSHGQTEFRSAIGKLSSLAYSSRPDICFDVKRLSTKLNNATKKDLQTALKRMMKVKAEKVSMKYPSLGKDLDH